MRLLYIGGVFLSLAKFKFENGLTNGIKILTFRNNVASVLFKISPISFSRKMHWCRQRFGPLVINWTREAIGEVVGSTSLIVETLRSVSLVVFNFEWTVYRQLKMIWSKSVSVGIAVREQSSLEHLIWGSVDSRYHMSRTEGNLFNLKVESPFFKRK